MNPMVPFSVMVEERQRLDLRVAPFRFEDLEIVVVGEEDPDELIQGESAQSYEPEPAAAFYFS